MSSREGSQGRLYQSNCNCFISGEHRGLGAGVSKVRSLKMDRKVWTETLIQVSVLCGLSMLGVGVASLSCCLPPHPPPTAPNSLASELWS